MEVDPDARVFFLPFIMVTTFVVVNLLVDMIVNFMQDAHSEEADQKQIPIVMRCWCDLT